MENNIRRILLVDDSLDQLDIAEKMLRRLGYNVISASDSTEALGLFKDLPGQFDLVITDYQMPGLNGLEFASEVITANPHIPIILCSGVISSVDPEKARASGVKWFAQKPLLKKDFIELLDKTMNHEN